jgi:ADP-dependent NAD(P)H-hydrate dehydratase / NAD(P)H-hydrate epimerase
MTTPVSLGATVQQMRDIDRRATTDYGVPVLLLMEHAGLAIANYVHAQLQSPSANARIVCVAGRGHNGGDGLAAIRLLHNYGYQVSVYLVGRVEALAEETAMYAAMIQRLGVPLHTLASNEAWRQYVEDLAQATWIIDALLGTGVHGPLQADVRRAIQGMNDATRPVLSVDVPSGLDADTGAVSDVAVHATTTITFGLFKHGCCRPETGRYVGQQRLDRITLPPTLLQDYAAS